MNLKRGDLPIISINTKNTRFIKTKIWGFDVVHLIPPRSKLTC